MYIQQIRTIKGWFCILWTILFAVSVSCQELTTVLPQDDDACMRNEVTFTCTVRGSLTLTQLILAWSSPEYIGLGDALQFTTQDMPGANNMSSMINRNVTAILISNMRINEVPELVSELHVIDASQTSVITCSSELNQTSVSTPFISSAYPGSPQIVVARERSAGSCDFLVTWNPPTNVEIFDIGSYIIYVPSRNMRSISFSTTIDLIIPNCRVGNNSILVAAVNRFGCIGPNSSHINLNFMEMQDPPSGQLGVGAVVGIIIAVILLILCSLGLVFVCICCVCIAAKFTEKSTQVQERLLYELSKLHQETFHKVLMDIYIAIKKNLTEDKKSSVEYLHQKMKETRTSVKRLYIKEAVKGALKTIELDHGEDVKKVLIYLKNNVPKVLASFDNKLKDKDTDITMDGLIRAAEQNVHEEVFDELIEIIDTTEPEIVEGLLRMMFEELQTHLQSKASPVEMDGNSYEELPMEELSMPTPASTEQKWATNLPGRTSELYSSLKDYIPMKPFSRLEPGEEVYMEVPT